MKRASSILRWIIIMILTTSLLTGLILPVSATTSTFPYIDEEESTIITKAKAKAIEDFIQQAAAQAKKQGYPVHYSIGQEGFTAGNGAKWNYYIGVTQLMQTNPLWAGNYVGSSGETIGAIGCAITSFAMILNTSFYSVYPNNTPATVNTALGNYASSYSINWTDNVFTALDREYYNSSDYSESELLNITAYDMYTRGIPFMLKVVRSDGKQHYVVARGFDIDSGGNVIIFIIDTLLRSGDNISQLGSYIDSTYYGTWYLASASQFIWD